MEVLQLPLLLIILPPMNTKPPQLIVALDVPSAAEIPIILSKLPADVRWFKVGLELFTAEGPAALSALKAAGKDIFLDLKLHDIPNTVASAVRSAAHLGVGLLTVHAVGGRAMLKAAADAAREFGEAAPAIIAVTTLTSLSDVDLREVGITRNTAEQALALGEMAMACGLDGLVTSVHECAALRAHLGPDALLVTPGIRPADGDVGDQKRVATPEAAVQAGATHLVVERPILKASDPARAAQAILDAIR